MLMEFFCKGVVYMCHISQKITALIACLLLAAATSRAQVMTPAQIASPTTTNAQSAGATVSLTLADALARAKANSPQFQAALMQLGIAREDRVQARATLLPGVDYNNSFIYTEGNGTPSGRFIANNGPHEYISQGAVQQVVGLGQFADYRRAAAAQAMARAKAEIAARGLIVTVVRAFYGLLAAQGRTQSTQAAADEAQTFLDNSRKLEQGGEVAHSDVIKAQIQANDQQRAVQDAKLSEQNARLTLAVLLFPNFFQDFSLVDDLAAAPALPPIGEVQQMAQEGQSRTERCVGSA